MRWRGCRAPGAYSLLPPDPRILLASPVRPSASRNVTAAGGRQPVVDDLSLQVMAERKAGSDRAVGPAVLAVALEEATRACERAAASLDLCRVAVERGRNACSGEPLSGHARCLHEPLVGTVELAEHLLDQVADAVRDVDRKALEVCGLVDQALLQPRFEQRLREQRVAAGALVQQPPQAGGRAAPEQRGRVLVEA